MAENPAPTDAASPSNANEGLGHKSISFGFLFRRNPKPVVQEEEQPDDAGAKDRRAQSRARGRGRKGFLLRITPLCFGLVLFLFVMGGLMAQNRMLPSVVPEIEKEMSLVEELNDGAILRFIPKRIRSSSLSNVDRYLWSLREERILRKPRLAIILGNMDQDPLSMQLFTVLKNLKELQYELVIFAVVEGRARSYWEHLGGRVSILSLKSSGLTDWSIFEGILASSLEAKEVITSILHDPFSSIPLIWIIGEDTLAKRFPFYVKMGWEDLIVEWRNAFGRADVVVFSDYSLPILYSMLDTGNFFVIPGSPSNTWSAENYLKSHSNLKPRGERVLSVVVVGSTFFYDKLSWSRAFALEAMSPLLMKFTRRMTDGSCKFIFLCGISTDEYRRALQDVVSSLGLPHDSFVHYGLDNDVNRILLEADIVLHGSFQDEQGFPPLLLRAMSFGVPVVAPNLPIIKKYIVHGIHGMLYEKHNSDKLMRDFSLLVSGRGLSRLAHTIAASGKLLAKNMMASECITGYMQLLENSLHFPSDVSLPLTGLNKTEGVWEWSFLSKEAEQTDSNFGKKFDVVHALEKRFATMKTSENKTDIKDEDSLTPDDWDILSELQMFEEYEMQEIEELEERVEKPLRSWDNVYNDARKASKVNFESNERDEGEIERIGQPFCIYEIYNGAGAWPFLHHGSLYRGLSLSAKALRSTSDDVDAVSRLPLLNNTYYKDLLCELGGMFAIANKVDSVHTAPWIGFQPWRATAKKVSLSKRAEKVLEEAIRVGTEDVIYYWARLEINGAGSKYESTFWSLCEILNADHCRNIFENAFRHMYSLPEEFDALPPMPEDDHGHWSALHSWLMPTPSFLEFMMFSRIFVDSLDSLNIANETSCVLGISEPERKHCFCRMLELLVNVWAYHSARKMVYVDPVSGSLEEQHPFEDRIEPMWMRFFNFSLLKSMDEDLAEAADDQDYPREEWLWPRTGEVFWKGMYEKEREQRYRLKMDKKKKAAEDYERRQKFGKKQSPLGGTDDRKVH